MANLTQYIYEEVLKDKLKLNSLSNRLGKIILQLINNINKTGVNCDEIFNRLKKIRVSILELENQYYNSEKGLRELKTDLTALYKILARLYKELVKKLGDESLSKLQVEKINRVIIKFKEFLIEMKKTLEIM